MDDPESLGTLVVKEVGPFYSIMLPHGNIPIGYHTVASRVSQPLRIYSRPGDKVFEILSLLRDSAQDFSRFAFVHTPDDCNIDISIQGDQAIVRLTNMNHTHSFRIQPTATVLARVLKASWQFFSEWDRTANCPGITHNVQFEISELQSSGSQFPGSPTTELLPWKAIPCENDSYTLRHGSSYGLELTNNSGYDLYPTVQWFDPSNEFTFGKLVLKLKLQTETYSNFSLRYMVSASLQPVPPRCPAEEGRRFSHRWLWLWWIPSSFHSNLGCRTFLVFEGITLFSARGPIVRCPVIPLGQVPA